VHDLVFTPGGRMHGWLRRIYASSRNPRQGPVALRLIEHASKAALFGCKDCGDCSLPDIAYLCPESQCAKNQRNGPCGGTRDGLCEVADFECIWSRAYDRLKFEGREQELLRHAPVIQDESLRGTSSWANNLLRRDHAVHGPRLPIVELPAATNNSVSNTTKSENLPHGICAASRPEGPVVAESTPV
jgi:methylenetetrahydrofolate reductase (NADPH)